MYAHANIRDLRCENIRKRTSLDTKNWFDSPIWWSTENTRYDVGIDDVGRGLRQCAFRLWYPLVTTDYNDIKHVS